MVYSSRGKRGARVAVVAYVCVALCVSARAFAVPTRYNDTQAAAALLRVQGGTAVAYLNRTTTDQLGGFGASAKQAIGRGMMAKQIRAIFEKARAGFKNQ